MTEATATPFSQRDRAFRAFSVLATPSFRVYWIGLVVYVVAWNVEYVTFNWLVWELTRDPLYLGYLGVAQGLPVFLVQILGGVFADRVERVRLLVGTQLGAGLTLSVAFLLTATGLVRVEHLLLLSVVSGAFRAFEQPTRMAMVPSLVERRDLPNAVALGSIPWQSGRVVGPSIGGLVIAALGAASGFGLSAALYYLAIALYSRVRLLTQEALGGGKSVLRDLAEGFVFIWRSSLFSSLIGLTFFNTLFGMAYITLLPIFADRHLGVGSGGYGLLQAASGIGAVLGTLTLAAVAHRLRRGRALLVGGSGFGLGLMVFSQSPSLPVALVVIALAGFSNTFYQTLVMAILQERVPNALRGRVLGIYGLCWNLIPLGGVLAAALAALADARFAVLVGGALVAAMAALMLVANKGLRSI